MTEPTTEMIDQWFREAIARGDSPQHAYFSVANAAAAWAREQALNEAERAVRQRGAPRSGDAIRALKGKGERAAS
jgi:hypothetical protein